MESGLLSNIFKDLQDIPQQGRRTSDGRATWHTKSSRQNPDCTWSPSPALGSTAPPETYTGSNSVQQTPLVTCHGRKVLSRSGCLLRCLQKKKKARPLEVSWPKVKGKIEKCREMKRKGGGGTSFLQAPLGKIRCRICSRSRRNWCEQIWTCREASRGRAHAADGENLTAGRHVAML